jgi:hypothetical protein
MGARHFTFAQEGGLFTNTVESAVIAVNQDGKIFPGDRHVVELRLKPETYHEVQTHGMRLLFRLSLPPGLYQLRAAAHEAGTGASGSVHYDVYVPDFGKERLSMSGIALTSTTAAATPTPRLDTEIQALLRQFPPTGTREFTPAETLAMAFVLYGDAAKPAGTVDVVSTIEGPGGEVRFKRERVVSDDQLREARDGFGVIVQMPLADLAPGTYTLRVRAVSRLAPDVLQLRELPLTVIRSK